VRQTGIAERLLDLFRDGAALAGDQRRGDPAGRARKHGVDPPRHLGAQMPQMLGPAVAAFGCALRAGDPPSPAITVADPADPGEIELALEVAPTRQYLGRHRIKHRLEPDMVARVVLVARLRNVKTQTVRPSSWFEPGQGIWLDDDAPALLGQIDVGNPSGKRDRSQMALQHRGLPLPGGLAYQRKAGGEDGQHERRLAPRRMPAQGNAQTGADDRRSDTRPQRWLDF
jgi:hypothetical protein